MTESPSRVPGTDAPQAPIPDAPGRAGASPDRPPVRRRRMTRRARRDALVFLAFAAPNLVLIAMFTYRPLFLNIQYSMLDWTLGSRTATFIGLDNYIEFFTSDAGLTSLRITAIFTLLTVGGAMVLGLLIALALNIDIPGRTIARSAVFAPYVLSGVGVRAWYGCSSSTRTSGRWDGSCASSAWAARSGSSIRTCRWSW